MAHFHAWAVRPEPANYLGIIEANSVQEAYENLNNPLPQDAENFRKFLRSRNFRRVSPILEHIEDFLVDPVEQA